MKQLITALTVSLLIGLQHQSWAQSTTGGKSGGSTASTGAGYETEGRRPAASSASSMTIADEGASRAYMYVPPTPAKNRSASPDGSKAAPSRQPATNTSKKANARTPKSNA